MNVPTPCQVEAMTPAQFKLYENRVRRIAARQLLSVHRTRRRDRLAHDYGTYRLADADDKTVTTGQLWQIHTWLVRRGGDLVRTLAAIVAAVAVAGAND
jgi:hypothetical protein